MNYNVGIIGYLDVCGFCKYIEKHSLDEAIAFIDEITNIVTSFNSSFNDLKMNLIIFSDSIFIFKQKNKDDKISFLDLNQMFELIILIREHVLKFVKTDINSGIVYGYYYLDNKKIFGPAICEAVKNSELTIDGVNYIKIIIKDNLFDNIDLGEMTKEEYIINNKIKEITDGIYFVNPYWYAINNEFLNLYFYKKFTFNALIEYWENIIKDNISLSNPKKYEFIEKMLQIAKTDLDFIDSFKKMRFDNDF